MPNETTFDIRPLLRAGREPYAQLRALIDSLQPGDSLTVIAPFLPSPLIELSRSLGHKVSPTHRADGAWATRIACSD